MKRKISHSKGLSIEKAMGISIAVHFVLIVFVFWSTEIAWLIRGKEEIDPSGPIAVDLVHRPTHTPIRQGEDDEELPTPIVEESPPEPEEPPPPEPEPEPEPEPTPEPEEEPSPEPETEPEAESNVDRRSVVERLRQQQARDIDYELDEEDLPRHEEGEEEATGTGGEGLRPLTHAEQVLESALKRHFEMPGSNAFRRNYPNAKNILSVRLIGAGNRLEIMSLSTIRSAGFNLLDRSCEMAVRRAVQNETFSTDIIRELSGEENIVGCRP